MLAALFLALLPAVPAGAQERNMQGWAPPVFRIVCKRDGGMLDTMAEGLGLQGTDCMAPEDRARLERTAETMLYELRSEGFEPPFRFGPLIEIDAPTGEAVRILAIPDAAAPPKFASIGSLCGPDAQMRFSLNAVNVPSLPLNLQTHALAHELFHSIQGNYANHRQPGIGRADQDCFIPPWVSEGMGDAVAISLARRHHGWHFPPHPGQRSGMSWAGLRPYNEPLFKTFTTWKINYRTSSFWRFLAERYHDGRLGFLAEYYKRFAPGHETGDAQNEDWLHWLDRNFQLDPDMRGRRGNPLPLYGVYPGFLTHFAGDWAKGGDGERFGRRKWLNGAFGGCESVEISPDAAYREIELSVKPMAGRCISLKINGLAPGQLGAVKSGVITDDALLADSLHLGFAFTNDTTGFNCAAWTRAGRLERARTGCLLEPVTGTIGPETPARMWIASGIEAGGASEGQMASDAGAAIENVYVLSRVPPRPRLSELRNEGPRTLKLAFGLEAAELAVNGQNVDSGGTDGSRQTKRTRATASVGLHGLSNDPWLPPSTGYVDSGNVMEDMGFDINAMIGDMQGIMGMANTAIVPGSDGPTAFTLGEAEVTPIGLPPDMGDMVSKREFSVILAEPAPTGTTGHVPAAVFGWERDRPNIQWISIDEGDAQLVIEENSRDVFRARVSATLCEIDVERLAAGGDACQRRLSMSGRIVKPFAYLYRASTSLHSIETDGEKLYNGEYLAPDPGDERSDRKPGEDPRGPGERTSATGGGGGSAGAVTSCDCSCENRDGASPVCAPRCALQWAACPSDMADGNMDEGSGVDQARFRALLDASDLPAEVTDMLVGDFGTQPRAVQESLIRHYEAGGD